MTVEENLLVYGRFFDLPKNLVRQRTDELLDFVQLADRRTDVAGVRWGMSGASRSSAPSSTNLSCCCWTNPPPGWTRRPATSSGSGCTG